jgi:hypothetical protein
MGDVVLIAAGGAVVIAIGWDIALTLLHPSARGPISYVCNRSAWNAVRALSRSHRSLSFAGPAAMWASMITWVFGLWFGHALIYASAMSLGDALYTSGEALTTVGFGQIEFDPEWLRYVAIAEAAGGLGTFTAVIAYVLSVYPLVSRVRASSLFAGLTVQAGDLAQTPVITRRLIEVHEDVKRFQVLYYFESGDEGESIATLLKSATVACIKLRETGNDTLAEPLERALSRLFDDLEHDFIGGRSARTPGEGREDDLAARADRVIGAFAEEHRQEYRGLSDAQ